MAAFLVLHELTAVAPLVGLAALFHAHADALPLRWALGHDGGGGAAVREGAARFERYFRRKGWFGFEEGEEPARRVTGEGGGEELALKRWAEDARYRVVLEVAVAWTITKVLLPVRIAVSLWATPWFARVLVRMKGGWR